MTALSPKPRSSSAAIIWSRPPTWTRRSPSPARSRSIADGRDRDPAAAGPGPAQGWLSPAPKRWSGRRAGRRADPRRPCRPLPRSRHRRGGLYRSLRAAAARGWPRGRRTPRPRRLALSGGLSPGAGRLAPARGSRRARGPTRRPRPHRAEDAMMDDDAADPRRAAAADLRLLPPGRRAGIPGRADPAAGLRPDDRARSPPPSWFPRRRWRSAWSAPSARSPRRASPFAIPGPEAWAERLEAVLSTLEIAYAKAHEDAAGAGPHAGYANEMLELTAGAGRAAARRAGEVLALAALVRYAEARRPARVGDDRRHGPAVRAGSGSWGDRDLIADGDRYLHRARNLGAFGPRALNAAIHGVWCARRSLAEPAPWPVVLRSTTPCWHGVTTPIVRLNRAVALAEVGGRTPPWPRRRPWTTRGWRVSVLARCARRPAAPDRAERRSARRRRCRPGVHPTPAWQRLRL